MYETPNLDCMDADALVAFADCIPEDLPAPVWSLLTAYAAYRLLGMGYRLDGYVEWALLFDAKCEQIFKKLPSEYRW